MLKRLLIILIIFSMLFALLSGCSGNGRNNSTPDAKNTGDSDSADGNGNEVAVDNTTERIKPDLPDDLNFNGDTFTFLVTGPAYGFGYYETIDIYTEEQNGETLNDAVYIRNRNVEEKLNINIAQYKSDRVSNDVKKTVSAGDNSYDAIFGDMYESSGMAQNKLVMNLKEMPYIDLDKPWWDKNAEQDLSVKNKLYFTVSDISTMAKACTRLLIFNKKLVKDFELGDPYEHVKNNTWTFDVYAKMVKSVYVDVNGNGQYDDEDIYGVIRENHSPYFFSVGFGERLTTNDGNGYPQITYNTDRLYDAINKICDLYFDDSICRGVENMKHTANFTNVYTYARSLFSNDRFLFHLAGPLILEEFRDMESDFGLLPMPKLNESQPRYYHTTDPDSAILSIPITCDPNKTGAALEAMAAESMYTVTPAYNETLLKRKYVRDDESEFILDIVYASRTYDLCRLFGWGGLNFLMDGLTAKKSRNLASEIEKIQNKTQKAIDKTVEAFE